jgi:hypothetical protein
LRLPSARLRVKAELAAQERRIQKLEIGPARVRSAGPTAQEDVAPMQGEGYCECQCGRLAPPGRRFVHGHNGRKQVRWLQEDRGYLTPCWIWQLAKNRQGYGLTREGYAHKRAHRVVYEQHIGPIPPGLDLDHLCRQTDCVNPAHMEPVTEAENVRRGNTAKITMDIAQGIRARIAAGERQADIARGLGVSQQVVCDIKKNRTWVTR